MREYIDAFGHKHYYDDGKQGETKMENELYGYCQVVGCKHFALDSTTPYCNDHSAETGYCNAIGCMEHVPKKDKTPQYCKEHQTSILTVWDYEQAINSQSACNATGLINSLNDLREKLWNNARQLGKGTEWVNHHPILQLYAYQLAHLTHSREPIEWEGWKLAYDYCCQVRDGEIMPDTDYTLTEENR